MDDPNITMEEYIRLEEEKARRHDLENEFPAIVYNDGLTSKSDFRIKPLINSECINLIDETSLSEYDEEILSRFNDLFNDIHPGDLKSEKDDDNNIGIIQSSEDNEITHGENGFSKTNMAPLPAADQRHPWLRYQIEEYTEGIRHSYEQRLKTIWSRPVDRVHVLDFEGLTAEMRQDLAVRLRMVYSSEGKQLEMAEAGFGAYWAGSDRLIPGKGGLRDYWLKISSGRDFLGPAPSYVLIRDPVKRIYHRMIAYSISGYLRIMNRGTINVPHLLAQYVFRHVEERKSGARVSREHFIGCLAMHFRLVSDDGLRGLQVVTRELPLIDLHELERLYIYMSWCLEANEVDQAVEEVAPEIPAPAPVPTQAPPPPPPAPQLHTTTSVPKLLSTFDFLKSRLADLAKTMIWYMLKRLVLDLSGHSEALVNTLFAQELIMENYHKQNIRESSKKHKAKKALLQKGTVCENLTKKIYTGGGKLKRAWIRDCEIVILKHRCSKVSKPEKVETLKSFLDLLRKGWNADITLQPNDSLVDSKETKVVVHTLLIWSLHLAEADHELTLSNIVDTNFTVGTIFGVWPGDNLTGVTGGDQVTAALGICERQTTYVIAIKGFPGTHNFLILGEVLKNISDEELKYTTDVIKDIPTNIVLGIIVVMDTLSEVSEYLNNLEAYLDDRDSSETRMGRIEKSEEELEMFEALEHKSVVVESGKHKVVVFTKAPPRAYSEPFMRFSTPCGVDGQEAWDEELDLA
ncbi:reverse transcriptase domain-containing protein [Tanacetum coccineum]